MGVSLDTVAVAEAPEVERTHFESNRRKVGADIPGSIRGARMPNNVAQCLELPPVGVTDRCAPIPGRLETINEFEGSRKLPQ